MARWTQLQVIVTVLIHRVDHGDCRRALLVEVAQTTARHDVLQDVHVESAGDRSLLEEFLHLRIDVAIVLFVLAVQLGIPLRSHLPRKECRRLRLCLLLLLYGNENAVLIDIDGCNPLLLEQLDRLAIQNGTALNEYVFGIAVIDRTTDEHLRQQAPNGKRF